MSKLVLVHEEARDALERGVNQLATIVKSTLGPKGRNVMIDRPFQAPMVSTDGVFIAQEIALADPFENMGAQLLKEVASHTNDVAGDGTTTATVLAQAMVNTGLQRIREGSNPVLVKRGMEQAVDKVVEVLKESARPVDSPESCLRVAALAAKDIRIGKVIADALQRVGIEGTIMVDESNDHETTFEVIEGMRFDRGFLSHDMVNDPDKMEAVLNNAHILIIDDKVSTADELLPIMDHVPSGGSFLVIAEDVSPSALGAIHRYRENTNKQVVVVRAPEFGMNRKLFLEDIAIFTGAQVLGSSVGRPVEQATSKSFGKAEQVRVGKDTTTIVDGKGNPDLIRGRRNQIRHQLEHTFQEYEREKLQERLSKLSAGIAVILAGGVTKIERRERKLRIEDALNATQAAVQEGVVPGGGVALLNAQDEIERAGWVETLQGDERIGAECILNTLTAPFRAIAENCGLNAQELIHEIRALPKGYGYNALTNEYVDMMAEGIVDPVRVTYSALKNAVSIAGLIITTESLVTDKPEEIDTSTVGPCRGGGAELLE